MVIVSVVNVHNPHRFTNKQVITYSSFIQFHAQIKYIK